MKSRTHLSKNSTIGVYSITTSTGKTYVGMTCIGFTDRWISHVKELEKEKHRCKGLQNSYNKRGLNNLTFTTLQEWETPSTLEMLKTLELKILKAEKQWWEQLKSEGLIMLHGCPTGTGSVLHSNNTKLKLSIAAKNNRFYKKHEKVFVENLEIIKNLSSDPTVTAKSVQEQFNISKKIFHRLCEEHSINFCYSQGANNKIRLDAEPITEWLSDGVSLREISRRLNISYPIIQNYVKNMKN